MPFKQKQATAELTPIKEVSGKDAQAAQHASTFFTHIHCSNSYRNVELNKVEHHSEEAYNGANHSTRSPASNQHVNLTYRYTWMKFFLQMTLQFLPQWKTTEQTKHTYDKF